VGGVGAARDVDRTDAAVGYLFLFLFAQRDDDGSGPARLGSVSPGPPGLGSRPDDLARFFGPFVVLRQHVLCNQLD
jgi:hypothetical protein